MVDPFINRNLTINIANRLLFSHSVDSHVNFQQKVPKIPRDDLAQISTQVGISLKLIQNMTAKHQLSRILVIRQI